MDQKIEDFYAGNKIPIAKMVMVGVSRRGLSEASITHAAEAVYNEVMAGRIIAPIRLAWEVFSRAKSMRGYEMQEIKQLTEKVAALKAELELPWYRRIFRRTQNV